MYVTARSDEVVLTESRTLRQQTIERTDVLDKVGVLITLPDSFHATTEMVSRYYEVPVSTIDTLVSANFDELTQNGRRVLQGFELRDFATPYGGVANLGLHHNTRSLAIFSRRAILNIGQLLTKSEVARKVRTELLNAEGQRTTAPQLPTSFAEALELAAALARQNEETAAELKAAAPKIEAHNRLISSGSNRLVREVAKELGLKEGDLRNRLVYDWRWAFTSRAECGAVQYNASADKISYFATRENEVTHRTREAGCWHVTLLITSKGREAIRRKLDREQTASPDPWDAEDLFEREGGAR